jgi:hypothetical protein
MLITELTIDKITYSCKPVIIVEEKAVPSPTKLMREAIALLILVITQLRGNRDWWGFKAAEIDSKAESP